MVYYTAKRMESSLSKASVVERERFLGGRLLRQSLLGATENTRKRLYHELAESLGLESELHDLPWRAHVHLGTISRSTWFSVRDVEQIAARLGRRRGMALGENLADIALRFERVRTIWSRWDPKNLVTEIENMFKKLQHSTDAQKGWQQATHARDSEAEVSDRRLASHFVSYNSTAHGYGRVQHYGRAIRLAEGLNEAKRTGAEEAKLQYYIQMTYPKDAVIPNAQDSNWLFRRGQIQRGKYLGEKVLRFTEDYGRGMMAPLAICVPPSMLENWTRVEVSSLLRALEIAENHECFVLLSRLVNIELERTQALGSAAPLALGWADEVLRLAEQHPHQSMDDDAGSDDSHATQENRSDNGSDDDRRDDNARERNDNNNNSPRSARMDEDEGQRHDHGNEMDVDDEQAGDERPPMASGALGSKRGSAGPDTE